MPNDQLSDLAQNPEVLRHVYDDASQALRVLPKGQTAGGLFVDLLVDADGTLHTTSAGGPGGGGTEYDEDTAHVSGNKGTLFLAIRNDSAATTLTDTDGDYSGIAVDSSGRVHVIGPATAADIVALDTSLNVHLENLTDWSVANRCSVSPISGSNGVQGGSGAVSASTQRVVLATDVALPAGTNAIGKLSANSGVDIGDVDVTSLPAAEAGYVTGTLAFGSVNGSGGAYATLITMSGTCKALTIFNTTNQDITVSFDASTIHGYVPSRGSWTVDYQANLIKESSNVSVRYATTTVGVSGAVFGNAVT